MESFDEYIREMIRKSKPKEEDFFGIKTLKGKNGYHKQLLLELDEVFKGDRSVYYKIGYFLYSIIAYLLLGIIILTYFVFPVLLIVFIVFLLLRDIL
jgi:hypothetical protein